MDLDRAFYSQLLKSDLSLDLFDDYSNIVCSLSRKNNKQIWDEIYLSLPIHQKSINTLTKYSILNISASPLVNDIRRDIVCACNSQGISINNRDTSCDKSILYLQNISELNSVKALIYDKSLHQLVSLYLRAPAQVYTIGSWIQYPLFPHESTPNTQKWHRDRDDFRFLKLFMNITDVNMSDGPHAFIPFSHDWKNYAKIFRAHSIVDFLLSGKPIFLDNTEFNKLGCLSQPYVWTSGCGNCFLEDTRGFHRAFTPTKNPRLMFSVTWTVGDGFHSENLIKPFKVIY